MSSSSHRHPTQVHSPSSAGLEKRGKLLDHSNCGGGDHPPPLGAYLHHLGGPHNINHLLPPPPHGYYGHPPPAGGDAAPGVALGSVGTGGGPPVPSHGYGYGPPPSPYHPGHHHLPNQPPPHDPYFSSHEGGGAVGPPPPPSPKGYYVGHLSSPSQPHPGSYYGAQPLPQYSDSYGKYHPPRAYLPPRLSGHHHHPHYQHRLQFQQDVGDYNYRPGKTRRLLPPPEVSPPSGAAAAASLPVFVTAAVGGGNDDTNADGGKSIASPNGLVKNDGDGVDDTRSPEGTRNLNTLEERVVPNSDGSFTDNQQQQEQQRDGSSSPPPIVPWKNNKDGIVSAPVIQSHMAPYGMPPPPPGMMSYPPHPHPAYNQYPPPMMPLPPSPHHHHNRHFLGYPSPASHHHHHHLLLPHQGALPSSAPQFQLPFHSSHHPGMSLPPPVNQVGEAGGSQPPRTPSNAGAVVEGGRGGMINSTSEMTWSCEFCNLKFPSWERCSTHEASECPAAAAAYAHQHQMGYGPPHLPPLAQYPTHIPHGGMIGHQASPDTALSSRQQQQQRGRKMALPSFPNAGRFLVNDDAEYCINVDRPTYVLSTPDDGNSLSDRQCYVRSHFVEAFVAGVNDVGARHSRGAQKLHVGQVGLRCAYCVKLKPRDRAERAVCYPSSISRIYQTVADMQRFHFESCVAIPPKVLQTYKSLKTTRPRGQGSPQSYWDKSAHEIGLADTKNGIQVTMEMLSCGRRGGDVFETQRKSIITGMLARLDGPAAAAASHDVGQGAMIMQGMMQGQVHMTREEDLAYESCLDELHQDPQVLTSPGQNGHTSVQSAVVSSPGSEEDHGKNSMYSSPGSHPGTPNAMPSSLVTPKETVQAEEDANILLMLKKTSESPPRNDISETARSTISDAPVNEYGDTVDTTTTDASSVTEDEIFVPESPPRNEISEIISNTIINAPIKDANGFAVTNKDALLVKEEDGSVKD
ncbi:hypothetical protein ACHAXA_005190 [Cyclostephanos tholiformis]|uniref:C2H2-type domain-containing protein n=1 Tax=Cyclostephanos tholiformis TaxID=382380 RepID=A0ABD3RUF2_9STRA